MKERWLLVGMLILLGAGWGATQPMSKIAVSEGYRNFGLIFWQFVVGALLLGTINLIRRRPLPLGWTQLRLYAIIALIGTILPNTASYEAARFLPAGVLAAQVSYLETAFGIFWAMILLSESYSSWIWLSLGVIFVGLSLVQPKRLTALAGSTPVAHDRIEKPDGGMP